MLIGHRKQIAFLKEAVAKQSLPHAFLFSGPEKVGKRRVAFEFIKYIFCESKDGESPCGKCQYCRSIEAAGLPDLTVMQPNDGNIEIEQVRMLQEKLSLKSYLGNLKVGIIDDAHLMRTDAQNALLKTLEEPKGDSLIILITPYPLMLLPTVRSRLQQIKFSLVSNEEIEKELAQRGIEEKKRKEIIMMSSGQAGKAIEFAEDKARLDFFNGAVADISKLLRSSYFERFNYAKEKNEEPEVIINILDVWERFFRREMLIKVFRGTNPSSAVAALKEVGKAKNLISRTNTNKRFVLENLLINI